MNKTTIHNEVMQAYADAHMSDYNKARGIRKLNFLASESVSAVKALTILKDAIPNGYNGFRYNLLSLFPSDTQVIIAREGSPCLYVKGKKLPSQESLNADEYDRQPDGTVRI